MSAELMDQVRGYSVIVVNGAFRLAPWALALAANDSAWWQANPDAMQFAGEKVSFNSIPGVMRLVANGMTPSTNSGVLGLQVASHFGATSIVMIGADFHGDHFFGKYEGRLKNATPERRKLHARQFEAWAAVSRIPVWNATPGSALRVFPVVTLAEALAA
jgi:hypothetical protein